MTRRAQPPRRRRLLYPLAVVVVVVLAAAVGLMLAGWQQRAGEPAPTAGTAPMEMPRTATDEAVLFFVAANGMSLVEHYLDMPLSQTRDTLARARMVAEQQLAAPPSPLLSPFPPGTSVRAVYLGATGDAFVDLSTDVARTHPGGSLDELLTVYAIVNALTINVPEISAVQILVGGREVDTLAGHVDLRRPLEPSLKWVSRSRQSPEASNQE